MKKSWVNQEVKPFLDNPNHELMIKKELRTEKNSYLINNPRMFNGAIVDLAEKPYIPQNFLLQRICCKCHAGCNRHSYF